MKIGVSMHLDDHLNGIVPPTLTCIINKAAVVHKVKSDGVSAEFLHRGERIDHVANALGHLGLALGPVSMRNNRLGNIQPGGHQKGRPVHRMESQDVLADHLGIRWPATHGLVLLVHVLPWVSCDGQVVGEGVHPDIHDVAVVSGNRDTPCEPGSRSRNREIGKATLEPSLHLCMPALWYNGYGLVGRSVLATVTHMIREMASLRKANIPSGFLCNHSLSFSVKALKRNL